METAARVSFCRARLREDKGPWTRIRSMTRGGVGSWRCAELPGIPRGDTGLYAMLSVSELKAGDRWGRDEEEIGREGFWEAVRKRAFWEMFGLDGVQRGWPESYGSRRQESGWSGTSGNRRREKARAFRVSARFRTAYHRAECPDLGEAAQPGDVRAALKLLWWIPEREAYDALDEMVILPHVEQSGWGSVRSRRGPKASPGAAVHHRNPSGDGRGDSQSWCWFRA